tara:strand:+ start:478 stop:675 length:198 start_codon:yes stop_codon:yes gene_type:complete
MTKFSVPEMSCGHCKSTIEKAVAKVDSDAQIAVDLTTREVTIESQAETDVLVAAMKAEGYEAHPV